MSRIPNTGSNNVLASPIAFLEPIHLIYLFDKNVSYSRMERSRRGGSGAVTTAPSGTGPTPPSAPCAGNVHLSQFKTIRKHG
jgi:hypothetical protein